MGIEIQYYLTSHKLPKIYINILIEKAVPKQWSTILINVKAKLYNSNHIAKELVENIQITSAP